MGALRGAVTAGIGLIVLYDVSTSPLVGKSGAGGLDSLFSLPGNLAHWLISPDIPLVPDLRGSSSTATKSSATTSTSTPSGVIVD